MVVGKRIVELRQQRKLTTNKLANLAGVSQSYLREVELGNKNPTVEFLSYICHGLHISLHDFFAAERCEIDPYLLEMLQDMSLEQQFRLAEFLASVTNK